MAIIILLQQISMLISTLPVKTLQSLAGEIKSVIIYMLIAF